MFFRALADSHGSRSACIVMSGTGPNGSAGLRRIKEYGGLVLAQDPADAEYPDMPRNAMATGLVDFVLPVAEMPARLASYLDAIRRDEVEAAAAATAPIVDAEAIRDGLRRFLRDRAGTGS